MRYKTYGIVLGYIKFKETSIIAHIFTEKFGKQSYMVNCVRQHRPKINLAFFQPLVPLEMIVYHKQSTNLQRLLEATLLFNVADIIVDCNKSCVTLFLAELLNKVLYGTAESKSKLFKFVLDAIEQLNQLTDRYAVFYLQFILKLSQHLGFGIYDMSNFDAQLIKCRYFNGFTQEEYSFLHALLNQEINLIDLSLVNKHIIRRLLMALLRYFQLHISTLGELRSLNILQALSH